MLNNKQIAGKFDLLAKLMELHDDNPFKIKTYANAYLSLRKLEGNLAEMSKAELASIKGVGSTVADKIKELIETGEMVALEKFREMTPEGVQQMLSIKGLGPKKVKQIWKEMEIETIGELLYACNENRLVTYSGFGPKIQADIIEKLEYFIIKLMLSTIKIFSFGTPSSSNLASTSYLNLPIQNILSISSVLRILKSTSYNHEISLYLYLRLTLSKPIIIVLGPL